MGIISQVKQLPYHIHGSSQSPHYFPIITPDPAIIGIITWSPAISGEYCRACLSLWRLRAIRCEEDIPIFASSGE
jgi:hypothetical protein